MLEWQWIIAQFDKIESGEQEWAEYRDGEYKVLLRRHYEQITLVVEPAPPQWSG